MSRLLTKAILWGAYLAASVLGLMKFLTSGGSVSESSRDRDANEEKQRRANVRRRVMQVGAFLMLAAFGGLLVTVSGIIPIKASSGHWAITEWFLSFTMRRSVVTHSLGQKVPALDDPALVLKGASHYHFGCRPCHGGPDTGQPLIPLRMTPHPPSLSSQIRKWEPDELFYIVKHGVKFTGMPAWPSQQRDDEVWAMVAFLLKLPDLTPQEYRDLAAVDSPSAAPVSDLAVPEGVARVISESCARCHGVDGMGRGSAFPRLAGQRQTYLHASLLAYARGDRHSGIMQPLVAGLSANELRELALYYAKLPAPAETRETQEDRSGIERGREIATRGVPSQRIPPCVACHGPSTIERNPSYPELAGQPAGYLSGQLHLFQKRLRGGTPYASIMQHVVGRMSEQQMRDVGSYYASLPMKRLEP